ncbi:MAG: hypothetical protein ACRELB_02615, partial [Polyangiaceae bacterium]
VTISVKTTGGEPLPPSLRVTWDGATVAPATLGVKRPADPGTHVVHAAADGYSSSDVTVTVPAAGSAEAPMSITKSAPPAVAETAPPAPVGAAPGPEVAASGGGSSPWPWVAFGVGGAGLLTGAVTGAMVLGKHSGLAAKCPNGTCPPDQQSSVDSYDTLGMVSTVGFVVAGAGAALGVTLLLLKPGSDAAPASTGLSFTPVIGPGSLGAIGRF